MITNLARNSFRFSYLAKYKTALEKHYKKNDLLEGYCNPDDSLEFSKRNSKVHKLNWKNPIGIDAKLTLSSMGIGTYNGEPTNQFDYQMFGALVQSIKSGGINHIDTCSLYRYGKSERVINAVLNYLIKEQEYKRGEFMVSTKLGYIPKDIDSGLEQQDFIKMLITQNIVSKDDIVNDIHCVAPNYLQFSLQKSRIVLGLETVDIFYLNNFSEAHLPVVGEEMTYLRLKQAFAKFEEMRSQNRIRYYGLSSYVGLRSPKTETEVHFQLQRAVKIAKELAGDSHGFRFIMVPFSLGTPQILLKWQDYYDGTSKNEVRVFDIAEAEKINIVSCAPLFQGRVAQVPFQSKVLDYFEHNSAKHLQLIRSFPSNALVSTLVGMTQPEHVDKNLSVLGHPLLTEDEWRQILPIPE